MFGFIKKKVESILFLIIRKELLKRNILVTPIKKNIKETSPIPYKFIEQSIKESNLNFDIDSSLESSQLYVIHQRHLENYGIFFQNLNYVDEQHIEALRKLTKQKVLLLHGQLMNWRIIKTILHALENKCTILFSEDGFLSSITRTVDFKSERKYRIGCSLIIDKSVHFDCSKISRIEQKLNSNYEYSESELDRAQNCIDFILKNYISKYNNQPVKKINFGKKDKKKILIVDQAINDFSITLGGCSEETFLTMLRDAMTENPNADILIKVHPDMIQNPNRGGMGNHKLGHFTNINTNDLGENIYIINEYINPISLLKSVDKVYVATSQLGFEALLCNKEVIIYGVPFYAGWGIGECRNPSKFLNRRTKKRTLREIFHAAYIDSSIYINPDNAQRCEIEQVLQYLLNKRNEYLEERNEISDLIKDDANISTNIESQKICVPVAFCFNEKYRRQAIVAIWSLLKSNKDDNLKYRIYCIYENDVSTINLNEFRTFFINCSSLESLHFIKNDRFFEGGFECRGITKAAYTRLMLHRLIENEDTIIYSDVDVLFFDNLRELYQTKLGNYLMGACIDVGINDHKRFNSLLSKNPYWKKYLWDKKQNYYSSGILLLNLRLLREYNKDQIMEELSKCKLPYQDMDIINILFNRRIMPISSKYCVIPRYIKKGYCLAAEKDIIPTKYAKDINNAVVFHFAGAKPWNKKIKFKDIWWKFVKANSNLKSLFD